jgi:hypothetical protein
MNIFQINNLIKHNLKTYEELVNYINNLNIIVLNKPSYENKKYYFSIEINEDVFCILSIYDEKNNIKIEIIGRDNNNIFRILDIFNNINNVIEYFKLNYNIFIINNNYISDETTSIYDFSFEDEENKNIENLFSNDPFEELNNNEDLFEK